MEKSWFIWKINKIVIDHEPKKKVVRVTKKPAVAAATVPAKEEREKPKSMWQAFMGVIDSVIDLIKSTIRSIFDMMKL